MEKGVTIILFYQENIEQRWKWFEIYYIFVWIVSLLSYINVIRTSVY